MNGFSIWLVRLLFAGTMLFGGYYIKSVDSQIAEVQNTLGDRGTVVAVNKQRINRLEQDMLELKQEIKDNRKILLDIKNLLK